MSFINYAQYAQDLKSLIREAPTWGSMGDDQREVLEVIASSLAHIISDNPNNLSDWSSLYSYSGLIKQKLQEEHDKQWANDNAKAVKSTKSPLSPTGKMGHVV